MTPADLDAVRTLLRDIREWAAVVRDTDSRRRFQSGSDPKFSARFPPAHDWAAWDDIDARIAAVLAAQGTGGE